MTYLFVSNLVEWVVIIALVLGYFWDRRRRHHQVEESFRLGYLSGYSDGRCGRTKVHIAE